MMEPASTVRGRTIHIMVLGLILFGLVGESIAVETSNPIKEQLPEWLKLDAEYRLRSVYIDPLDLSGEVVRETAWTEQRLRLDVGFKVPETGGIYLQLDILDGVLMGDNGDFPGNPQSNSGVGIATQLPNQVGYETSVIPGQDPVNPDSYAPRLKTLQPIEVNHAYGEVYIPFGVLRIGRMPYVDGPSPAAHDGGRHNKWGVSSFSHTADRILFGTKLDEAIRVVASGGKHKVDASLDDGLIMYGGYDWLVQDDLYSQMDDLHQWLGGLEWRVSEANLGALSIRDFKLSSSVVHRRGKEFSTSVTGFPQVMQGWFGPLHTELQVVVLSGETREISEGFALLSNRDASLQGVSAMGGHAGLMYRVGALDIGFDFDYASGDADPRTGTDITSFSFARDYNVGLLLFEHILAFESARSAAVGIENLSTLSAPSFPLTEVSTYGRFNNAYGLFPQFLVRAVEMPEHLLTVRGGALMAWPEYVVVDPVMVALAEDGVRIDDDIVNFHGGPGGDFYGVELDLQLEWTYRQFLIWTLEGAYLIPGDGLEDEHGDAVHSYLLENRFTFVF